MQSQTSKILYFRSKNKSSYALTFTRSIGARSLELLLSKREGIQLENIALIYRGRILQPTMALQNLQSKSIIHVIDLSEVRKESIQISIKSLDNKTKTYAVKSETMIQDFIKDYLVKLDVLPQFYIALAYAGKMLSPFKTFQGELVENGCEIIIVDLNQYTKNKKSERQASQIAAIVKEAEIEKALDHREVLEAGGQEEEMEETVKLTPVAVPIESKEHHEVLQGKRNTLDFPDPQMQHSVIEYPPKQSRVIIDNASDSLSEIDPPLFNIQVSQVESVSTEQDQHNLVQFHHEEQPFSVLAEQPQVEQQPLSSQSPKIIRSNVGEAELGSSDLIYIGQHHENQTKSFIDKLMKKYRLMFE